MRRVLPTVLISIAALALLESPELYAKGGFVALPPAGKAKNGLQLRVVRYTGGSSGKMVIDVRNKGQREATFVAKGLFFVPAGNPDSAPQRLGAAGPFEDGQGQRTERVSLAPGKTMRLRLQVFCLDSHRSSPGAEQGFSVARKRLPKNLSRKISTGAKRALDQADAPEAATSVIQSQVWKARNKKWIKLEGERRNEKSSSTRQRRHRHRHRQRVEQQLPIQQRAE